jgi:hypothetical protein
MPFDDFFVRATGNPTSPYEQGLADPQHLLPPLLFLPTGVRKTAAIVLACL